MHFFHILFLSISSVTAIDNEITSLKQQLAQLELKEMGENVQAESYMIADWKKYGEDLKDVKNIDDKQEQIRHQIQELEKRKEALLKS